MADMSGTTFIVLNISWTALPDIDHYEVHIDQHPATLVMNTTIITMCESSLEENHTVHLTAVNTCGRQSSTTLSDIRLMNYVTTESIASSRDYNNGGKVHVYTITLCPLWRGCLLQKCMIFYRVQVCIQEYLLACPLLGGLFSFKCPLSEVSL